MVDDQHASPPHAWPAVAPQDDAERGPGRPIVVDGQTFVVRFYGGGTHFDWVSGPNPDYGFTTSRSDGAALTETEWIDAARNFLTMVDPVTGYIE